MRLTNKIKNFFQRTPIQRQPTQIYIRPKVTVFVNEKKQTNVRVEVEEEFQEKQENPLEGYLIRKEPYYEAIAKEKKLFETSFKSKLPLMLKGPTGCGKTRFIEHMAYELEKPLITVSCQEDLTASDLCGRILLNENGTYWQDGPLALAARYGGICYLDEVVEARNDSMVLIHSLTDHRRILPIDKTGETIKAHEDFMLVISYNPHYQSSLKEMKPSTRQRFIAMDFDYPQAEVEAKIVQKESGLDYDKSKELVEFGRRTRLMKGNGVVEGASTRLLVYAGQLMQEGIDKYQAIENAIISPITDEQSVSQSLISAMRDVF